MNLRRTTKKGREKNLITNVSHEIHNNSSAFATLYLMNRKKNPRTHTHTHTPQMKTELKKRFVSSSTNFMSENILRVVTFIVISVPSLFWLVSFYANDHLAFGWTGWRGIRYRNSWRRREREEKNELKMYAIELIRSHL